MLSIVFIIILLLGYFEFVTHKQQLLKGNVYIHVIGQSWDNNVIDEILIPNIKINLQLVGKNNIPTQIIAQGITNEKGECIFTKVPRGNEYLITIDTTSIPGKYYLPYQRQVLLSRNSSKIDLYIRLFLNESSIRDLVRQGRLLLYQNLLEVYKKDHGYYPLSKNFREKIININDHLITLLTPYLIKNKLTADKLLDPLSERPIVYWSDGNNYKIWIFPEIILDISVFNKKENAYFIEK
ncbi:MAG: hypothetical protein OH344_03555 [Candidatus Parvarchaeota archaeon]|nr:hypothetical protein [Candidatus Jingweiarchaeum tengchongense]